MLEVFAAILSHPHKHIILKQSLRKLEILLRTLSILLLLILLLLSKCGIALRLDVHRHVDGDGLGEGGIPAGLALATGAVVVFAAAGLGVLGGLLGGEGFLGMGGLHHARRHVILLESIGACAVKGVHTSERRLAAENCRFETLRLGCGFQKQRWHLFLLLFGLHEI